MALPPEVPVPKERPAGDIAPQGRAGGIGSEGRPQPDAAEAIGPEGRLAENIARFVQALRRAGVPVGTAQLLGAVEAVSLAGFSRRDDFYFALRATLVSRPEHFETFHQLFALFWKPPDYIARMMELMLPMLQAGARRGRPEAAEKRAREAVAPDRPPPEAAPQERPLLEMDARQSASAAELLRQKDFAQMSAAELAGAEAAIRRLTLPAPPVRTRRLVPSPHGGRPDLRAMLRRSLRRGGEVEGLMLRRPGTRPPALVVLCDISGSMATYSRMMMHFLHSLTQARHSGWGPVHAFTFGTRLTNVSRVLQARDVDAALAALGRQVRDWEGGTRIGAALHAFNRDWSRRVLGQGAVVLLITDGLERGELAALSREAERLALSSARLVWLNPLLRWEDFEPKAGGIRALLPHVSSLHACHSLASLADLSAAFAAPGRQG